MAEAEAEVEAAGEVPQAEAPAPVVAPAPAVPALMAVVGLDMADGTRYEPGDVVDAKHHIDWLLDQHLLQPAPEEV